jgi:hypothetical protein
VPAKKRINRFDSRRYHLPVASDGRWPSPATTANSKIESEFTNQIAKDQPGETASVAAPNAASRSCREYVSVADPGVNRSETENFLGNVAPRSRSSSRYGGVTCVSPSDSGIRG